jgi:hypothetical protein
MDSMRKSLKFYCKDGVDNPYALKGFDIKFREMSNPGPDVREIMGVSIKFSDICNITFNRKNLIIGSIITWQFYQGICAKVMIDSKIITVDDDLISFIERIYNHSYKENNIKIIPDYNDDIVVLRSLLIYTTDQYHSDDYWLIREMEK